MDVHKDSITVAYAGEDWTAEPVEMRTIGTRLGDIDKLIRKLGSQTGNLVFVYEAGPVVTGCIGISNAKSQPAGSWRRR